jgi:hypothetical protein
MVNFAMQILLTERNKRKTKGDNNDYSLDCVEFKVPRVGLGTLPSGRVLA